MYSLLKDPVPVNIPQSLCLSLHHLNFFLSESHAVEMPGHLSAGATAAKETGLVLLLIAVALWGVLPKSDSQPFQAANGKRSIAVLAFEDRSGKRDQEYFAEGIAEDLITDLSKLSRLFVTARNSSFFYKGKSLLWGLLLLLS